MAKATTWTAHNGQRRPATGDKPIIIRLRCQTREMAETQEPRPANWWPRWAHGNDSGDIMEWKYP